MKTIKYNNKTPEVITLCDMLNHLGYNLVVSDSFTTEVDIAVKDFQSKNNLVVDGIVGTKSWSKLFELQPPTHTNKFLSENDLQDFADLHHLELAVVKAVNEVESGGKGFLISGKPKILFEGHIFWKELEKADVNPNNLTQGNEDVLYKSWTKKYYLGGEGEHARLEKAIRISPLSISSEPALASASWGSFQIMGFHAKPLGYASVTEFVSKMELSEREHLMAFGKFCLNHPKNLINYLRNKDWATFAYYYNGAGYKQNKYDLKLANAYKKYSM